MLRDSLLIRIHFREHLSLFSRSLVTEFVPLGKKNNSIGTLASSVSCWADYDILTELIQASSIVYKLSPDLLFFNLRIINCNVGLFRNEIAD